MRERPLPGAVHRALFIRTDRLGETLLTLPAMAALKAALPQASLTLLAIWHRHRPRLGRSLPTLSLLGITFTGLAFKGLGAEPLLLVAALAALGVLVYLVMRWRRRR